MKLSVGYVCLALAFSSSAVNAVVLAHGGHRHHHRRDYGQDHGHNDDAPASTMTITQTVTVIYGHGHGHGYDANPTPTSTPIPTTKAKPSQELYKAQDDEPSTTTTTSRYVPSSSADPKPTSTSAPASGDGNPECEFPDGECDCDNFPSSYGAVPVEWMKLGGWTGIQLGDGAGSKCEDGALCSYACPPGYSKAQWPSDQPANGESRGGLSCKDGKLYKTRPENSGLCIKGHGDVYVKNELTQFVPICRTDYPGSENMVIPLSCPAGSTTELTVPISDTYYVWQGKTTSAQYYVNPAGTTLEDGCIWGKEGGGQGNWSPMIFGAGYSDGIAWLSISQNQLNNSPLGYNVKIVGGPGSQLNGNCKYENGQFSGGAYGEKGCTAALKKGTAYFVLYN